MCSGLLTNDGKAIYDWNERYDKFKSIFSGKFESNFDLAYDVYRKRSKEMTVIFNKWKSSDTKKKYTQHFSPEKWKSLPQIQKQQHTIRECRACLINHLAIQSSFPVKCKRLQNEKTPGKVLRDISNNLKGQQNRQSTVKPKVSSINIAAKFCYDILEKSFRSLYNTSFADALVKVKDINLQKKPTKVEQKDKRKKVKRQEKENIKHQ